MKSLFVVFATLTLAAFGFAADIQTQKKPVTDEYQGVKVEDDYQWLEKDDDPAVKAGLLKPTVAPFTLAIPPK